jgi:aconitate hydratase
MNPLAEKTFSSFNSFHKSYYFFDIQKLGGQVKKLPRSICVVLESVLRFCDGKRITERDVNMLASWDAKAPAPEEIPFTVARIVLQDFTGVPLLVDLAAMRSAVSKLSKNPKIIEPLVPVDLVVDHSVQVDFFGTPQSLQQNIDREFERNRERYEFLKWGQQAFETFKVIPPGIGIVHQVNLEFLAQGVLTKKDAQGRMIAYPDSLVGTDSHTTMINGLGVVGWGVGGIEAEAGMLGQPIYFLTPEVVGVYLTGALQEGVTATDLTLTITEMLRKAKVVGKFVEFYGPGATALTLADRATIGNMAPEYGATMGYFPVDEETIRYMRQTGRSQEQAQLFEDYYKAQQIFGIPQGKEEVTYSTVLELDLSSIQASVAGPKRPQDRIVLPQIKQTFDNLFIKPLAEGGFGKTAEDKNIPANDQNIHQGDVLIAAITSCTNTSNPTVMVGAGLLAKRAVEAGLTVNKKVKTSLAPGSRVVADYLQQTGLQPYLDQLGFNLVGFGCTTCIGNSGPLAEPIEKVVKQYDVVAASVLSGNRNFEARVHPSIRANFLMSPPLVVAFALAGRVDIDMTVEPIGKDKEGKDVFLKDLWPSSKEIKEALEKALRPEVFQRLYKDFSEQNPAWNDVPSSTGDVYVWNDKSTYIQQPPFFTHFSMGTESIKPILKARVLGLFGDSVTTDHISPAGSIKKDSPAGRYLMEHGIEPLEFNSYGSRRGNDQVMTRGTFANVRIKNLMLDGVEGGFTKNLLSDEKEQLAIYDAAVKYQAAKIPLMIIAGKEYGTGSSRDWAAKGTFLLGVKAVLTESFERIHRSNLVGMGILPLCFQDGTTAKTLGLDGTETFSIPELDDNIQPRQKMNVEVTRADGTEFKIPVVLRIDTPIEVEYYKHGGILPYVLRQLLSQ